MIQQLAQFAGFQRQRNGLYLPPGVMPFIGLGGDCCGVATNDGEPCTNCNTGTTPADIEIIVPSGTFIDGALTCTIGGTYILSQYGGGGSGNCLYLLSLTCVPDYVAGLNFAFGSGGMDIVWVLSVYGTIASWHIDITSPFDCRASRTLTLQTPLRYPTKTTISGDASYSMP